MHASLGRQDSEYVFWLNRWSDTPALWSKVGQFKCIITRKKINIIPIEHNLDDELNVDISLIQDCKINDKVQNPNRAVELILNDGGIILSPINPFEPRPVLNVNHNEISAMVLVIDAFRANTDPQIDTNPYVRQLG